MRFRIVYDGMVEEPRALWGFSCLVENRKNILFDTGGDADILKSNMEKLNIEPRDIDILVISHEHWDHIGGLLYILGKNPALKVYVPESFSESIKNSIGENAELVKVSEPIEIEKNIFMTGELGSVIREQSLIAGDIVVTGCAHPGIVEIAKRANELIDDISLMFGGFHLADKSEGEIMKIINALKKIGVKNAIPCHCSGNLAASLFGREFKNNEDIFVGKIIEV